MESIVMYTTFSCPFCMRAKNLLKQKYSEFSIKEIRIDSSDEARDEMLAKSNGRRTVPQIFINGKHIGGHTELANLDATGELAKYLKGE